jgi:hypothetical protein
VLAAWRLGVACKQTEYFWGPTYKSTDIKFWYSSITTFLYQKWSTLRDFFNYFNRPMSSSVVSTSKLCGAVNMADFISGSEYCALLGYRGADKSLADQEGNKLPRPNSSFCRPLKKKSEGCPSNQVSAAAMTSASKEKWRPFNCFFGQVGLRTYQHPCITLLRDGSLKSFISGSLKWWNRFSKLIQSNILLSY